MEYTIQLNPMHIFMLLIFNYSFPSLEIKEVEAEQSEAEDEDDIEEVFAEKFKCLRPGCKEEGTAFANAAELGKHEM